MTRTALVTGASVAGNTVAWWLAKYGFEVEVVEKAPEFRTNGQNVDLRGTAREVIDKMGMKQAVESRLTGESSTAWVDADDQVLAEIEAKDGGPTAEVEILRGDLATIMYDANKHNVKYAFGDAIQSIEPENRSSKVTFESGRSQDYDVVIVAEGVGSSTRELVFPGENDAKWMDMDIGYFTIPKGGGDGDCWRIFNAAGGLSAQTRPDPNGTTKVLLSVYRKSEGEERWGLDRQRQFLLDQFSSAGWEVPRILEGLRTCDDFHFDVLRQVRMPRYHAGNVVLTGDAAWCSTPISGIGTTLAVVGAYILAGELAAKTDQTEAFEAYAARMNDFVKEAQSLPKIVPRMTNPHSNAGVSIFRGTMKLLGRTGLIDTLASAAVRNSKEIIWPDYDIGLAA